MLFADNFWLVAASAKDLAQMMESWLEILAMHGWTVPLEEASWCTTGDDDDVLWEVRVHRQVVTRAARDTGFKV